MAKQRNALKAGIFIVIGAVLIVAVLIGIKGLGTWIEPVQVRTVSFALSDNIGGLRVGDEVRLGGYKVGVVRSIDVVNAGQAAEGEPQVIVHYSIPKKYIIHEGARLGIETTVTGTSVLNFLSLGHGPVLAAGQALGGEPSPLQQVFASLAQTAPELKGLVQDVRQKTIPQATATIQKFGKTADTATDLVAHLRGQVDPVLKEYHSVASSAVKALDSISGLFGDIKGDTRGAIANIRVVTGDIKDKLPPLLSQADGFLKQINTAAQGINASMKDIQATVTNAKETLASAREIISGNRSKFDNMIASLKTTSDNLKYASEEIRRSPWRLLYKPRPGEIENLNIFDSARQFAEGANDLDDAAGALRDALRQPHPDSARIEKLLKQLDQSFGHFQKVEQQLWHSVRE
jgi:ABC-type transporter Mla subunit MlaD